MPFTPSDEETDWVYAITTVPGIHTGDTMQLLATHSNLSV